MNSIQNHDTDDKTGFYSLLAGSTNSTDVEEYYDDWAETYDATLKDWNYQTPAEAAATLSAYLKPGSDILDVGCGTGMFSEAISNRGACRIEGIDISAASLSIAKKKGLYHIVKRHNLEITPLPAATNTFDAAACVGVLTYIENAFNLLLDLCRVVRSGGYVLFTQRNDKWTDRDFPKLIDMLQTNHKWKLLNTSKEKPYLPKNEDFRDNVRVIEVLCRVN